MLPAFKDAISYGLVNAPKADRTSSITDGAFESPSDEKSRDARRNDKKSSSDGVGERNAS